MCVRASHERSMQHAWQRDIGTKLAAPLEKTRIFQAR